ncbi:hypothetical protein NDU88_002146 [Pleurodeles waltl]|uniref:Uncharacterized protein n=1 Tax=Pleurodeles waltl TaxID=8319 RepID=A0AAV7KUJ2_PLEWA|nr:hypothetical protein NDU88_002146 [Pleurodeles waltl]
MDPASDESRDRGGAEDHGGFPTKGCVTGRCRQARPGKATGADSAASTPEKDQACPNPGALPRRSRQTRRVCGAKERATEKEPADGDDNEEKTGTEEETLQLEPVVKEYSFGRRESADRTCLESPEATAAWEVFCDSSSHASGEAWPSQVRDK